MSQEDGIIRYVPGRAIVLRNVNCAYCGSLFDAKKAASKEHVIGRRFVPRGCFDGQWNLILNACEACNGDKADLEDDISAISMQPDLWGRYAIDDPRLVSEALRKAQNARSRRTRKLVAKSQEEVEFEIPIQGGVITYALTAPPQIDEARIFRLAHYHFRGFFFLITHQEQTRRGGFVQGGFFPLITARRADWGNPWLRWFYDLVADWELRIHAIGGDTFFKMIIRRHPEGKEVWAWALEWNHAIRTVGFAGDETEIRRMAESLPNMDYDFAHEDGERPFWGRVDQPLLEVEDRLFLVRASEGDTETMEARRA